MPRTYMDTINIPGKALGGLLATTIYNKNSNEKDKINLGKNMLYNLISGLTNNMSTDIIKKLNPGNPAVNGTMQLLLNMGLNAGLGAGYGALTGTPDTTIGGMLSGIGGIGDTLATKYMYDSWTPGLVNSLGNLAGGIASTGVLEYGDSVFGNNNNTPKESKNAT